MDFNDRITSSEKKLSHAEKLGLEDRQLSASLRKS
mgnify:CR=1 FL=1